MFKSLKARFALIAALALLSVWVLVDRGITLGLDLRGGTHLALEIEDPAGALSDEQLNDALDRALTIIRSRINELGVAEPLIQRVGEERISVDLPGATREEQQRARDIIQRTAFLQFQIVAPLSELESALPRIDRVVAEELDAETAGAEPVGGVQGLFEAAPGEEGADTAAAARPFTARVIPTGAAGQFAVAEEDVAFVEQALALPGVQRLLPRGTEFRWGIQPTGAEAQAQPFRQLYLVESRPLITGEYLEDAQAQRDPQFGRPEVVFELNRRGGRIFEQGTGENIGEAMAIVLDERVYSAPTIESAIGTSGRITLGGAAIEEARDLALVLRAGALPAPIQIVEERSVGPSLGADSIEQGQIAGIIGIVLVVLIMIGYYRVSGAMAIVALTLYLLLVLGTLAGIDATLTLPGIAGIVLSIGMAVDANVLIFERIREELEAGRSPRPAVNEGFANALSAIVDSQLTTLITAFILFQFGTGPVRGFAVTLAIGLIASMFTAIFITRTFFMLYLDRRPAAQGVSI